jgi:midasin
MEPSNHLFFLLQSLAEKGGPVMENITAHENFFVLATMNPGGDYGKKELSPALRNRFTEIWVPPVCDLDELGDIASKRYVQLRKLSTGVVLAKQNQKLSFFNFNPFFFLVCRLSNPELSYIVGAMLKFWEVTFV